MYRQYMAKPNIGNSDLRECDATHCVSQKWTKETEPPILDSQDNSLYLPPPPEDLDEDRFPVSEGDVQDELESSSDVDRQVRLLKDLEQACSFVRRMARELAATPSGPRRWKRRSYSASCSLVYWAKETQKATQALEETPEVINRG